MNRRRLLAGLGGLLAALALAGCGRKGPPQKPRPAAGDQAQAEQRSEEGKVKE